MLSNAKNVNLRDCCAILAIDAYGTSFANWGPARQSISSPAVIQVKEDVSGRMTICSYSLCQRYQGSQSISSAVDLNGSGYARTRVVH